MRTHLFATLFTLLCTSCSIDSAAERPASTVRREPRFESLQVVLTTAATSPCLSGLQPIPATVIDTGIFKNVPYQSFSNGVVELNGYGDPNDLVALEAGTKLENETVRQCIANFIAAHALFARDRVRATQFGTAIRSDTVDGLTIETTPATASDAYGAWWFSLELTHQVAGAAASDVELEAIVMPIGQATSPSNGLSAPPPPPTSGVATSYLSTGYSTNYSSYRPSSAGRVFVRGYTRKDGTYVHSYTRRR